MSIYGPPPADVPPRSTMTFEQAMAHLREEVAWQRRLSAAKGEGLNLNAEALLALADFVHDLACRIVAPADRSDAA